MSQVPEMRRETLLRDTSLRTPQAATGGERKKVGMWNRMGPGGSRVDERGFEKASAKGLKGNKGTGNSHGSQRQGRHLFSVWYSPL